MADQTTSIVTLISLGKTALEESSPERVIELLERYVQQFKLWYDEFVEDSTDPDKDNLIKLDEIHCQVLRKAKESQQQLLQAQKHHISVGKAIMAYVDILPKRVSLRRMKKG